jgi:hypothetical protein
LEHAKVQQGREVLVLALDGVQGPNS